MRICPIWNVAMHKLHSISWYFINATVYHVAQRVCLLKMGGKWVRICPIWNVAVHKLHSIS